MEYDPPAPRYDDRLREALDGLYAAFSAYPAPTDLDGSPYKDAEGMLRALRAAPLRELSHDQIGPYAGSALLTVGGVAEYKHYLPRIIEHSVLDAPHMGTDPPIIAERLKRASWRTWRTREQEALRSVFLAAWSWAVEQPPSQTRDSSEWLCGIAALEEPVIPLLADWAARPSPNALLQAASLAMWVEAILTRTEEDLAYWSYVKPEVRGVIAGWFTNEDRIKSFQVGLEDAAEDNRWPLEEALRVARGHPRH